MKKRIFLILLVFAFTVVWISGEYLQTAQFERLMYYYESDGYYQRQVSLQLPEEIEALEFFQSVQDLVNKRGLDFTFQPFPSNLYLISEDYGWVFYYSPQIKQIVESNLDQFGSRDCPLQQFNTNQMSDFCYLNTIISNRDSVSYLSFNYYLESEGNQVSGFLRIIGDIDQKEMVQRTISDIIDQWNLDYIDWNINLTSLLATVSFGTHINLTVIFICFFVLLIACYVSFLNNQRDEISLKKSMGYSTIDILVDSFIKQISPLFLICFLLFPIYYFIARFNLFYISDLFILFSIAFGSLYVAFGICQILIYFTIEKIPVINILKGKKVNTSFKDIIILVKFLITVVLLLSGYIANLVTKETKQLNYEQAFLVDNFSKYKRLQCYGLLNISAEQIIPLIDNNLAFIDLGDPGINSDELEDNWRSIALFEDNYKKYNDIILHVDASFINYLNLVNYDIVENSIIVTKDIHLSENIDPYFSDFNIIYIDNQEIPDFTGDARNRSASLTSFVLIYDSAYMSGLAIRDILFDTALVNDRNFAEIMETVSNSLGIENHFWLSNLENDIETLYDIKQKEANSEMFNMMILILSFIVVTLLINYLIFNENMKINAIKKMIGYSNLSVYLNQLIINFITVICASLFADLTFSFWHSLGSKSWLEVSNEELILYLVTFTSIVLILDIVIILVYSKFLNKNLLKYLKRKEF